MSFFAGCLMGESPNHTAEDCRDDFTYTIKIQQILLSVLPASAFIIWSLWYMNQLRRLPAHEGPKRSCTINVRLIAVLVDIVAQLGLLVLSVMKAGDSQAYFVSSSSLALLAVFFVTAVWNLEASRSQPTSFIVTGYVSVSIPLDVIQAYTLWLVSSTEDEINYLRLTITVITIRLILALLELQRQSTGLDYEEIVEPIKARAGPSHLAAFSQAYQLLLTGYRRNMASDDTLPLDDDMSSKKLHERFTEQLERAGPLQGKFALMRVLIRALAVPFLLPIVPRIALTACQLCQPLLTKALLSYLSEPSETSSNHRYIFTSLTALVYFGIALTSTVYWYFQERAVCMARSMLAGAVYRKTVEIELAASDGVALTLMSADVERTTEGLFQLHEYWANSIQVGISCWLLSREIGISAVAPLVVVILCALAATGLSRPAKPRQKAWMEQIQKRVGLTLEHLQQIRFLKMSGLEAPVEKLLRRLRIDELEAASRFRTVMALSIVVGQAPITLSPIAAFFFANRTLSTTTIFTAMSYIQLLAIPLSTLLQMAPVLTSAFTCLYRIQVFLEGNSRIDYRHSSTNQDNEQQVQRTGEEGTKESVSSSAIKISQGNFGWGGEKLTLTDINIDIPLSKITMVIGPVGCGKSTFCKALLGEVSVASGQIYTQFGGGVVGYCDQTPYLASTTIRKNILAGSVFNEARYDEVLEATGLKSDLSLLPLGDQTMVGSTGVTVSDGQRQRISLARALYLDTNFLIFDDVLSGLDADAERLIFRRVFSSSGVLRSRGATVVFCTHTTHYLPYADNIIVFGSLGQIEEQGSFKELLVNQGYVYDLAIEERDEELEKESHLSTKDEFPTSQLAPLALAPLQPSVLGDVQPNSAVYHHYLSRIPIVWLLAFALFGISHGFLANLTTLWLKFWSEDITSLHPEHVNTYYLVTYAGLQVLRLISLLFMCLVCFGPIIRIPGARLHDDALRTVISAPLSFFTMTEIGSVANLFSQDMNLIDGELPLALLNLAMRGLTCMGMIAVIAVATPWIAVIFPFVIAFLYMLQKMYVGTSQQVGFLDHKAKSPLYSHFSDTAQGIATFRAFRWVPRSIAHNDRLVDASMRPMWLMQLIQRWLQFALQLLVALLAVVVVGLAAWLHHYSGNNADANVKSAARTSAGFTGASLITLMTFGTALANLIRTFAAVETSAAAVGRLKNFGESVRSEDLPGEDVVPPPEWPTRGAIEIMGLSASYSQQPRARSNSSSSALAKDSHTPRIALRDLQLSIAPGERLAICGPSGSGKSSLLLLLLRLLDPKSSNSTENSNLITIDDQPLHQIDRTILRQRLIIIPRETIFLPGSSFRQNLDAGSSNNNNNNNDNDTIIATTPPPSPTIPTITITNSSGNIESKGDPTDPDAEYFGVLRTVGLETAIAEQGGLDAELCADTLTPVQKRLFGLARAVLKHRHQRRERAAALGEKFADGGGVVLIDGVSADLDTDGETERVVVRDEFAGCTVVMAVRRRGEVRRMVKEDFDTVVVVDEAGFVVEKGRPAELFEVAESRFGELCRGV